jgi:hypothetical protein
VNPDAVKGNFIAPAQPAESPFKLKAGGQFDLATATVSFAGHATHLGQFTATGTVDPSTFGVTGTMTGASGDTLNYSAFVEPQPSGEILFHLNFVGGPGRLFLATGEGTGTITLDADFMFTLDIEGTFRKCVRDATHSCL